MILFASSCSPPYTVVKSVKGDFNQGDSRFGDTAGSQCSINSLVAICFSTFKKISIWNHVHLNFVLENGDNIYKNQNLCRISYFPRNARKNYFRRGRIFNTTITSK